MPVIPMTRCETSPIACRDTPRPRATTGTCSFDTELPDVPFSFASGRPIVLFPLQQKAAS